MDHEVIRWGIIGCGDVTEVKSGPAFNKVPHSKLVAVMRRNAGKAKDYAQRHGVAKWYDDAQALINDPDVNAIYIATPPRFHEEYAIQAMKAGKPVYLEKPMTMDAAAACRIASAVKETGVKLTVAHYRREQPLFLKIKSVLDEGLIGDIRIVDLRCYQPHHSDTIAQTEVNWRIDPAISGGGLFHDLAPHQLDLMLYFFGSPQYAAGASINTSGYYEADDTTSGQVVFKKNILFNGAWCFTMPERVDRCEIIGTKGKMLFSIFEHNRLIIEKEKKETTVEFERLQHVQQPMIQKVVEYFLGGSSNPCSAEEGVAVMKMIDAFTGK
jgi:predicted dehydrogenase